MPNSRHQATRHAPTSRLAANGDRNTTELLLGLRTTHDLTITLKRTSFTEPTSTAPARPAEPVDLGPLSAKRPRPTGVSNLGSFPVADGEREARLLRVHVCVSGEERAPSRKGSSPRQHEY